MKWRQTRKNERSNGRELDKACVVGRGGAANTQQIHAIDPVWRHEREDKNDVENGHAGRVSERAWGTAGCAVEQVVAYRRQEYTVLRSTPYRAATKNSGPCQLSQFGSGPWLQKHVNWIFAHLELAIQDDLSWCATLEPSLLNQLQRPVYN